MLRTLPLLAVLVLATGCAASRTPVATSPVELAATVLDGEVATVHLADGSSYVAVDVELEVDRTTFRVRETGATRSVPTDSLAEVAVLVRRGRLSLIGRSTLVGMAPGLAVTGGGLAWMIAELQGADYYLPPIGPLLVMTGGVLLIVAGTASGVIHGATTPRKRWQTIYRRPPDPGLQPNAVIPA